MKRRGAVVVVLKALGVVVLLAAALILTGRFLVQPWPERAPGVVLEPARPILREADVTPDNAYYYLRQLAQTPATSRLDTTRFAACGVEAGTVTQLEAWVQSMKPARAVLRSAANCANGQVPSVESFATQMPYISPFLMADKKSLFGWCGHPTGFGSLNARFNGGDIIRTCSARQERGRNPPGRPGHAPDGPEGRRLAGRGAKERPAGPAAMGQLLAYIVIGSVS